MPCPKSKRVAIVGCGYVGAAVGEALVLDGYDVLGTTTSPRRVSELQSLGLCAAVVRLDERQKLHGLLQDCATVIHTVAGGRSNSSYRAIYLDGVQHLIASLKGTCAAHLIYTSSTRVYGQDDGSWVDEDSDTNPRDEKGRILLVAEELFQSAQLRGMSPLCVSIVRLAGIHGPGREVGTRALRSAGTKRDDGDTYVNLIHRDDIVTAFVRLVKNPYDGTLNLSDGQPITRRELYDRAVAQANLTPILWVRRTGLDGLGKRVCNKRVKTKLGLAFTRCGV